MMVKLTGFPAGREARVILAAQTSCRAGGALLPQARGYKLPPLVTGLARAQMGRSAWLEMAAAARWYFAGRIDAAINLDHPDVKAAL